MAKITSNEYVKVVWIPADSLAPGTNPAAIPLSVLSNGLDLSPAIAWEGWALGATDSDDVDDRGITDPGNAVTRGFSNFEGTLSFFRDANPNDATSDYVKAFETFRTPRTYGYLVMRVAEKHWSENWAPADRISVFKFVADAIIDDTEGDDSVKFTVNFLPQGVMHPYTLPGTSGTITVSPATVSVAVGQSLGLVPSIADTNVQSTASYTSSASNIAEVSQAGVVTGRSAGSATISITHPSGTTASVTVTVTAA